MIEFKPVDLKYAEEMSLYIKDEKINEYGIIPTFTYSGADDAHFCIKNDCLISRFFDEGKYFYTLSGEYENFPEIIKELKETEGKIFVYNLTREKADFLLKHFPESVLYDKDEGQYDYLYDIPSFLNLSGKKARHKRENYNKFINSYDFEYKELTKDNFKDCFSVLTSWCKTKSCVNCEYACEHAVLHYILRHYDSLPVKGGIMYENNLPIAFFIGEIVGDCLMGYHQKTLHGYTGIGYAIYIEALKNGFSECKYFNLGPDIGIEGLRQFKRQFKPYTLVEKYIMEI
jgi:hypothetical protein